MKLCVPVTRLIKKGYSCGVDKNPANAPEFPSGWCVFFHPFRLQCQFCETIYVGAHHRKIPNIESTIVIIKGLKGQLELKSVLSIVWTQNTQFELYGVYVDHHIVNMNPSILSRPKGKMKSIMLIPILLTYLRLKSFHLK